MIIPIVVTTFFLTSAVVGSPVLEDYQWTHSVALGKSGEIRVFWKPQDEHIVLEVQALMHGYVGIGFSPNGGMRGADIVIGWIEGNNVVLRDYHGIGDTKPVLDEQQDYELLGGYEDDIKTVIRFKRKWNTCDEQHDMKLGSDTVTLIWAYHPEDPQPDELPWHGGTNRGSRNVHLQAPPTPDVHLGPHVKYWDITMENKTVTSDLDTLYWCKVVRLPKLEKKHHMIGYVPIFNVEEKEINVHHFILYECVVPDGRTSDIFEKYLNDGGAQCYSPNMPLDWGHCLTSIVTWAIGSEGELLPKHFGIPLGEQYSGATYFMLEMHYDNPNFRTFVDNSGVRIYYTDQLRENDGSVFYVGQQVNPLHFIPPQQKSFTSYTYCPGECTQQIIPEEGVKVHSVVLHSHTAGSKITLRHIRNGIELTPIAYDKHYNFNYQQSRILDNEVVVLPGDELLAECTYDTSRRTKPTFGGESTQDEMCLAFVTYYPRISFASCQSTIKVSDFFKNINIDQLYNFNIYNTTSYDVLKYMGITFDDDKSRYNLYPSDKKSAIIFPQGDYIKDDQVGDTWNFWRRLIIKTPPEFANESVANHFEKQMWNDPDFIKKFESNWKNAEYQVWCALPRKPPVELKQSFYKYPNFVNYHPKEEDFCSKPSLIEEDTSENRDYTQHPVKSSSNRKLCWIVSFLSIPIIVFIFVL